MVIVILEIDGAMMHSISIMKFSDTKRYSHFNPTFLKMYNFCQCYSRVQSMYMYIHVGCVTLLSEVFYLVSSTFPSLFMAVFTATVTNVCHNPIAFPVEHFHSNNGTCSTGKGIGLLERKQQW